MEILSFYNDRQFMRKVVAGLSPADEAAVAAAGVLKDQQTPFRPIASIPLGVKELRVCSLLVLLKKPELTDLERQHLRSFQLIPAAIKCEGPSIEELDERITSEEDAVQKALLVQKKEDLIAARRAADRLSSGNLTKIFDLIDDSPHKEEIRLLILRSLSELLRPEFVRTQRCLAVEIEDGSFGTDPSILRALVMHLPVFTDDFAAKCIVNAIYNGDFGTDPSVLRALVKHLPVLTGDDAQRDFATAIREGRFGADPEVLKALIAYLPNLTFDHAVRQIANSILHGSFGEDLSVFKELLNIIPMFRDEDSKLIIAIAIRRGIFTYDEIRQDVEMCNVLVAFALNASSALVQLEFAMAFAIDFLGEQRMDFVRDILAEEGDERWGSAACWFLSLSSGLDAEAVELGVYEQERIADCVCSSGDKIGIAVLQALQSQLHLFTHNYFRGRLSHFIETRIDEIQPSIKRRLSSTVADLGSGLVNFWRKMMAEQTDTARTA